MSYWIEVERIPAFRSFCERTGCEVRSHSGLLVRGIQVRHAGHWMAVVWNKHAKRFSVDRRLVDVLRAFEAEPHISKRKAASQRKYSDWLNSQARDNGVSFGDWLKQGAADIEPEPYCDTCRGTGMGQTDSSFCWACGGSGDSRGRDAFGRSFREYDRL